MRACLGFGVLSAVLLVSCGRELEDTDVADPAPAIEEDADQDGIIDAFEGDGDFDGDGTPDREDPDSDGDCIPDKVERGDVPYDQLPVDSDNDGFSDYLDLDSDGNTLPDRDESGGKCKNPIDTDSDGVSDFADEDDDADTILDEADGLTDFDGDLLVNRLDTDSDGDCLLDATEAGDDDLDSAPWDSDFDGYGDFVDVDADDDGIDDRTEANGSCNPATDTDDDGLPDHVDDDTDGDGLSDVEEAAEGTDPLERDSDGDGYTDGLEIYAESNPLDDDSFPEGEVVQIGPRDVVEGEGSYEFELWKVDVFVLLDIAYSYSCYHPDLPSFIEQLVDELFEEYDDAALGFALYDDYQKEGYALPTGKPFDMRHQVSTDEAGIKAAVAGVTMSYGGDADGSGIEALYQTITGVGYDQTCDKAYDSDTDIRPFTASTSDAFAGAVKGSHDPGIEGTGTIEGVGFRPGAARVVILTADNTLRDPDEGDATPSGSCFAGAGMSAAASAVKKEDARVLGINFYEYQSMDPTLQYQLEALAVATDSYMDGDGDGVKDDPAAIGGSWTFPAVTEVVAAVTDLIEAQNPQRQLQLAVGDDPNGWVSYLEATSDLSSVGRGDTVYYSYELTTSATLSRDDQFYRATIEISDDDGVVVTVPLWLVIRPE